MSSPVHTRLHSSGNVEWYTPEQPIELAREIMRGIELDPASCDVANQVVKATRYYDEHDDGLIQNWTAESVFCNPPYKIAVPNGPDLYLAERFVDKAIAEYDAGRAEQVILLMNNTPDRIWFQKLWRFPIAFFKQRIRFWSEGDAKKQPTHGNVFAYLGPHHDRFKLVMSPHAHVVLPEEDNMELFDSDLTNRGDDPKPEPKKAGQPFDVLRTNVKGYKGEIALTQKMCLHGDNQSGKSSLIDAIRIALAKKAPRDIGELCPDTADELFAQLEGPSGTAKMTSERKKTGWSKPKWEHDFPDFEADELDHIVPTVSMGNLLALGADATREAVFARFGNLAEGAVPTPKALSADQKKLWAAAVATTSTKDPAEGLTHIRQWLNARKRSKNAEIKVLDERKKQLAVQVAEQSAGSERLPELKDQLDKAKAWANLSSVRQSLEHERNNLTSVEHEAVGLVARKQALLGETEAFLDHVEKVTQQKITHQAAGDKARDHANELQNQLNRVKVLDQILQRMETANVHHCPLCTHEGADPTPLRAGLATKLEQRRVLLDDANTAMNASYDEAKRIEQALDQEKLTAEQKQRSYGFDRDNLKRRHEMTKGKIGALEASLGQLEESYAGQSAEDIQTEINTIEAAEQEKVELLKMADDIKQLRADSAASKLLEGQAKDLLKDLLVQVSGSAEQGVNDYMTDPFKAVLDLDKNVWRVVGADGKPHTKTSMCGSETGALSLALAQAWTHGSPLRILLLDDDEISRFSPTNLVKLLDSIDQSIQAGTITQAIIATTRPHEIPDGWTKLDMETK